MTQPEALRLADALKAATEQTDAEDDVIHVARWFVEDAAAELRRLTAVEAELLAMRRVFSEAGCTFDVAYIRRLMRAEAASCSNTFDCQCPKHFASQQSEQRPKRVLTAVWRDRAQRAEAQRDALLEALKRAADFLHHATEFRIGHPGFEQAHAKARAALAQQRLTDVQQEMERSIESLKAALVQQAEPVEPVARIRTWHKDGEQHAELRVWEDGIEGLPDGEHLLYTAPPQRKPLTEEEIQAAWDSVDMRHPRGNETRIAFARAVERAHGIPMPEAPACADCRRIGYDASGQLCACQENPSF